MMIRKDQNLHRFSTVIARTSDNGMACSHLSKIAEIRRSSETEFNLTISKRFQHLFIKTSYVGEIQWNLKLLSTTN